MVIFQFAMLNYQRVVVLQIEWSTYYQGFDSASMFSWYLILRFWLGTQRVTTNSLHIECLHCNKQCNQGFISQIREKTWERPVSCVDVAREWSNSSFHLVNDEYSFQCVYKYIYIYTYVHIIYIHMYNKATACICWIGINVGLPRLWGTHLCIHTYAYIIYDYILYIWYVFNFKHNISSGWKQKHFYLVMAFLWSCFSYCAASVFAPRTRHDQCDRLDQLREEKERPDPAAGPADDWRVDADISMFFSSMCKPPIFWWSSIYSTIGDGLLYMCNASKAMSQTIPNCSIFGWDWNILKPYKTW